MLVNRLFNLFSRQVQLNMSLTRFARLLLGCFVALFAVITPQTVFAARPATFPIHFEDSVAFDCGSFQAREDVVGDGTGIVFFDQTGNPIKVQEHINLNGVLTNLDTGFTLPDPGHFTVMYDLQKGTETDVGQIFRIIVPGEGIAALDAGKVIFDAAGNITFVGGPHQVLFGGYALLCPALG